MDTSAAKKWIGIILKVVSIVIIILVFEVRGLIAIGLYYIIIGVIAVWHSRKQVLSIKYYIESLIWGKPLHMFGKGEKYPKVKIIWGKDKNGNKSKDK